MSSRAIKIIDNLDRAFSNTPMCCIRVKYRKKEYRIYGKMEFIGLSSSGKDRVVRYVMRDAYATGKIKEGDTVVEVSSGNAGISLSMTCKLLGNKAKIFIPDWLSSERYALLKIYGADVVRVLLENGGFIAAKRMVREYAKQDGVFSPFQFDNPLNIEAHMHSTIPELFGGIEEKGEKPVLFVAGYGTGGVVMAASRFAKQKNINCISHPLEPSSLALLTKGLSERPDASSTHRIEGIVDDFVPSLLKPEELGKPVVIDDGDAIVMAQMVNRKGVGFGISSGANLVGCIKQLHESDIGDVAATIFCDSNSKYTSTDLFKNIPIEQHYVSSEVEILDIEITK